MSVSDGYPFGLQDAKIAPLNANGTYGTAVDVAAVRVLGIDLQTVSAMLEGDDQIVSAFSRTNAAQVTLEFGGIQFDVIETISGKSDVPSGDHNVITLDNYNAPYWGLIGKSDLDIGDKEYAFWVPKIKAMDAFAVQAQYGQFVIPTLNCTAIKKGNIWGIVQFIKYNTDTTLTIPPA